MKKVSDYIFSFLQEKGVKQCFMLPGGGAMHLVDSLGQSGMDYVCFQHEQGAACAAEAYGHAWVPSGNIRAGGCQRHYTGDRRMDRLHPYVCDFRTGEALRLGG